jgi:hypothetical protein
MASVLTMLAYTAGCDSRISDECVVVRSGPPN